MTVAADSITYFPCPNCGHTLRQGTLVCPNCGSLVYAQRLNQIAGEAMREEQVNPLGAAVKWREALPLLPPESSQYRQVADRVGMLSSQRGGTPATLGYESLRRPRPIRPPDTLGMALLKTGGSMLLSIAIYSSMWGWPFATGFVLLILVHELGHTLAMRYYGLSASPPIFIPFLGALINLREPPRNALEEAVVGIAGPLTGTIGTVVAYFLYMQTGSPLFLLLAFFGTWLNLFNLLPVPPLDGGRVAAAISPWIWIPGLLVAIGILFKGWIETSRPSFILLLLLFYAWPRVRMVLSGRGQLGEYYRISRAASWMMGVAYVTLGAFLTAMFFYVKPMVYALLPGVMQ